MPEIALTRQEVSHRQNPQHQISTLSVAYCSNACWACIFEEKTMLHYAIIFLVIALIAAVFGFGGIAASAVGIAKILFFVFLVMAVITFLMGLVKK